MSIKDSGDCGSPRNSFLRALDLNVQAHSPLRDKSKSDDDCKVTVAVQGSLDNLPYPTIGGLSSSPIDNLDFAFDEESKMASSSSSAAAPPPTLGKRSIEQLVLSTISEEEICSEDEQKEMEDPLIKSLFCDVDLAYRRRMGPLASGKREVINLEDRFIPDRRRRNFDLYSERKEYSEF